MKENDVIVSGAGVGLGIAFKSLTVGTQKSKILINGKSRNGK